MKHYNLFSKTAILIALTALFYSASAQNAGNIQYRNPAEINKEIKQLVQAHTAVMHIHSLPKSIGGSQNMLVEVGTEIGNKNKNNPAILVVANMEGVTPIASEAALYLLQDLAAHSEKSEKLTWYIIACGNPDAYNRYFKTPLYVDGRNDRPYNDDMDEATDEDGYEDLNADGLITQMRVKDPEGTYLPDTADQRIMKRADPSKGEKGIYKIYSEGIDNDGDGRYNEDGPGGTNLGTHFPHLFKYDTPTSGYYAGFEPEVHAILAFVNEHPEIALTMTYGSSNFCLEPPKSGRKGSVSLSAIKLPSRYARMLNADASKTYTLSEVKEMMKAIVPPGTTVDDNMVASMLNAGPAVNPLADDLKIYKSLSDDYKKYLKEKKFSDKRRAPQKDKDGSFELWSYYHRGLMSFSQDFWGVTKLDKQTKDKQTEDKQTKDKQTEDKETKEQTDSKAKVQSKKLTPMQEFLLYSDSLMDGAGFVSWQKYDHPDLGEVEIGGVAPFAETVPPAEQVDSLLKIQVPWVYELVKHIPDLSIAEQKVEDLGSGVYRVSAWIRNNAKFHFPTAMGVRNRIPAPALVTIEGKDLTFLSGKASQPITGINAFKQKKLTWVIQSENKQEIKLEVNPVNAYGDSQTIKLGGK